MIRRIRNSIILSVMVLTLPLSPASSIAQSVSGSPFRVEEKSITDIQNAITSGQTSCKQVVQAYIDRAKAYNGACTALLTKDGAPIPPSTGMVRAGAPLNIRRKTVAASTVFPDLDQYKGLPLELGQMETSISDPSVQLQYGLARRHSRGGTTERARNAEHSRRTLHHLQGRLRSRALGRAAAAGRSGCLRRVSQDARRAGACRRAGQAVRPQSGSGEAADVLRGLLAQGLVRRQGHARHRRQRRELCDGRAQGRLARHRDAAQQGRHHLRDLRGEQRQAGASAQGPNKPAR